MVGAVAINNDLQTLLVRHVDSNGSTPHEMNAPNGSLPDAADWFVILQSARVFVILPIDRTLMLVF